MSPSLRSRPPLLRRVRAVTLPARHVGARARLALIAEILVAYGELLPVLRRNDLRAMVARARRGRLAPAPAPGPDVHLDAVRLAAIVQRVLNVLPTDKRCLIESLVVVRVLAHREIDSRVVIGVDSGEAGFKAHAWVEHDALPVLPPHGFHRLMEL